MDDRDLPVFDLEHHHLASSEGFISIVQEEYISSLESRLHRTTGIIPHTEQGREMWMLRWSRIG